jgi:Na+/H+ antiporter NhaB
VPLSEDEQRILDQIEEELTREDPDLVRQVEESSVFRSSARAIVKAAVGAAVGIALVFAGLISGALVLSVAGFLVCVASVLAGVTEAAKIARAAQQSFHIRMTGWSARREQGVGGPVDG